MTRSLMKLTVHHWVFSEIRWKIRSRIYFNGSISVCSSAQMSDCPFSCYIRSFMSSPDSVVSIIKPHTSIKSLWLAHACVIVSWEKKKIFLMWRIKPCHSLSSILYHFCFVFLSQWYPALWRFSCRWRYSRFNMYICNKSTEYGPRWRSYIHHQREKW